MEDGDQDPIDSPSKSQRKREAQALTRLGQRLIELDPSDLARLPLSAALRQAIEEARRTHGHGARKRQMLFVGKLLRQEEDIEPVQRALEGLRQALRVEQRRHHEIEAWRDRLLESGDAALGDVLERFPAADRQHLRRLLREVRREQAQDKPPAAARELFRYLRSLAADGQA